MMLQLKFVIYCWSSVIFLLFFLETEKKLVTAAKEFQEKSLEEGTYNIFWNNELKYVVLGLKDKSSYLKSFRTGLQEIRYAYGKQLDENLHCPQTFFNCSSYNAIEYKALAMLHDVKGVPIFCAGENTLHCKQSGDDTYWMYELSLDHVRDKRCSAKFSEKISHSTVVDMYRRPSAKSIEKSQVSRGPHSRQDHMDVQLMFAGPTQNKSLDQRFFLVTKKPNVNLIYGFVTMSQTYIVYTKTSTDGVSETKVKRVCINGDDVFSYAEITLSCTFKGTVYKSSTSAYFDGSTNSSNYHQILEEAVLYVTFYVTNGSNVTDNTYSSVLCMFPLKKIKNSLDRSSGENQHREPTNSHFQKLEGNDQGDRNRLNLEEETLTFLNEHGTSLAVKKHGNLTLAFIGTARGNLMKVYLKRHKINPPVYNVSLITRRFDNDTDIAVRKSNVFDSDAKSLYLLVGKRVVKFPVDSCFYYKNPFTCVDSHLECGWCEDECKNRSNCKQRYTVPAVIHLDSPQSGPTDGGTQLVLHGGFGSNQIFETIEEVHFIVGNKKCQNVSWYDPPKNSEFKWSAQCITASVSMESTGPIVLLIKHKHFEKTIEEVNSSSSFSYLNPKVYGFEPGYGPLSGGTNVTVIGLHLDIGRKHRVIVAGVPCTILEKNGTHMVCRTEMVPFKQNGTVRVIIDDRPVTQAPKPCYGCTQKFEYKEDPIIIDMMPHKTIASGGLNLTVVGQNLGNVATPKLLVRLETKTTATFMTEKCSHAQGEESKKMFCRIPPLDLNKSKFGTLQKPLEASVTFIMDGVPEEKLRGHKNQPFKLIYNPDPIILLFNGTHFV